MDSGPPSSRDHCASRDARSHRVDQEGGVRRPRRVILRGDRGLGTTHGTQKASVASRRRSFGPPAPPPARPGTPRARSLAKRAEEETNRRAADPYVRHARARARRTRSPVRRRPLGRPYQTPSYIGTPGAHHATQPARPGSAARAASTAGDARRRAPARRSSLRSRAVDEDRRWLDRIPLVRVTLVGPIVDGMATLRGCHIP